MTGVLNSLGKPSRIEAAKALAGVYADRDGHSWFVVTRKQGKRGKAVTLEPARPARAENIIQVIELGGNGLDSPRVRGAKN